MPPECVVRVPSHRGDRDVVHVGEKAALIAFKSATGAERVATPCACNDTPCNEVKRYLTTAYMKMRTD